ncbi:class I SAM-dependent DNA methyltransferase [Mycolicibacterium arenosum]|uniref:Class I SAM-dependent methyltransferase n=1 Tax=Mycolicibacterium arenosum TaxID=2952157 RepID=A0ABT1MB58_9MYCO|nr:class I SAM-dependent methyltransferase [Mycolicibacterium sp. CAU 1645]MCP9275022.1 class I SAM-dependent methyltransferase [Mycolicibacterium sp. CAU 1645]
MSTRWSGADTPRGDDYDARWTALAAQGRSVHGEADLIDALLRETGGSSVLDGGCGTGRVAIELARRGYHVTGVDADPAMLNAARAKAPELPWFEADLAQLSDAVGTGFDLALLAGNVMIFVAPGTEGAVLAEVARRLTPGGLLVAGFQLREHRLALDTYDRLCTEAGLTPVNRWATWDREPYEGGDYAVSVHARADSGGTASQP